MKKKLTVITLILFLLTAGGASFACAATRGLKVYRLGTTMGKILTAAYQPCFLVSAVFLLLFLLFLLTGRKKKKDAKLEP